MSVITNLTRMWLTKTVKPFTFKNEYDERLPYSDTGNMGLYIHIPFCRSICGFCPYCKVKYEKSTANRYIDALIKEIHLAGSKNGKKKVTSLYFGGGTPALAKERLAEIIAAVRDHFDITEGIGIELHPDDVNAETLSVIEEAGVTKISIGIQSFTEKHQAILGRNPVDARALKRALEGRSFETVSTDLIFALPDQTFEDLRYDIDTAFDSGANHIAIYPFIDFDFTNSKIKAMPKQKKRKLLDEITNYLTDTGCERDSVWTFSKVKGAKYSSMTRDNFLGFGCSAATLLKDQFKINTFSVEEYIKRVENGKLPTSLTLRFTPRQRMVYYLFWTAYTTRIDKKEFEKFFGSSLEKNYRIEFFIAKLFGFLTEKDGVYEMTLKGAFYYHYYENFYTLSYIDKMWGIMRKEAFPEKIEL